MISSCACFSGKSFLFIIQVFGGEKNVDFFYPIINFSFWGPLFIHGFHVGNWLALLFQASRPWLPCLNLVMVKRVCFCEIVFYSRHLSFVSVADKNKYMERGFIRRNMYRVHGGLFVQYQELCNLIPASFTSARNGFHNSLALCVYCCCCCYFFFNSFLYE